MKHRVIVVGGGNVGNVEERLDRAATLITERVGTVINRSKIYRSEAWGFTSAMQFCNVAYVVDTELSASEVVDMLHAIETELGRNRTEEYRAKALSGEKYAERVIDLDVALYDKERIVTPHLMIPHVGLLHRDFFIEPVCEVLECDRESLKREITEIINANSEDDE